MYQPAGSRSAYPFRFACRYVSSNRKNSSSDAALTEKPIASARSSCACNIERGATATGSWVRTSTTSHSTIADESVHPARESVAMSATRWKSP